MKRREIISKIIFFILAFICAAIMMLPLIWMVMQSLQSDPLAIYNIPPKFNGKPTLKAYKDVFADWNILLLFFNTMKIMVGNVLLTILSSLLCGYGFARFKAKGKRIMFALLMSTMMLPWSVTLIPSYAVWSKLGLLGTYLPLILPSIGGGAFNIFLVRTFIMNIPKSLDEAAEIDGCNKMQILFRILIPQLTPVIATILVFQFTGVWNDYVGPYTYLWGFTEKYTLSIKLAISFKSEMGVMDWPKFMAGATIISLPVILVTFFAQNAFTRGIVMSGLKE